MAGSVKFTNKTDIKELFREKKDQIKKAIETIDKLELELILGVKIKVGKVNSQGFKNKLDDLKKAITPAHKSAIRAVAKALETALNEAMGDPVWQWSEGTRDIVDTGKLRDSLKVYIDSDLDIHILYNEDYAAIVHYGGYFSPYGNPSIKEYYPGRPWVDAVLNGGGPVPQFRYEEVYEEAFSKYLESRFG